jgi:hypothetical protein
MADESKQYKNFDLKVTEEKIILNIKAGTSMFKSAAEMPREVLMMTKVILPNGDLQMTRVRNPQNHKRDIMFASYMGVDLSKLNTDPWAQLDRIVDRSPY